LLITNGEFVGRWSSTDSVCIEIGPKVEGKVSLVNCSFWGPIDRCVWMQSRFGQFTASACHFVHWDNHGKGAPAIQLDAGKAIVQACTFSLEGTHVQAGERVRSAILTANQAAGGFRVDNRAGIRVQMLANETDPLEATPEARSHYRIQIGALGDGQYLKQWNGREHVGPGFLSRAQRWSTGSSAINLPVMPGKPYEIALELSVPKEAESPDAGLYLDGKRLAAIKPGDSKLVAQLPPSSSDRIALELRCRGWVPKQLHAGSKDDRTLGMQVYSVKMQARGADSRVFDANKGEWGKTPATGSPGNK
jgi:hypothetical protein